MTADPQVLGSSSSSICGYPALISNTGRHAAANPELRGPLDILGRNFRAYLEEHSDQEEAFLRAMALGDVEAALSVVQAFFLGLPDFKDQLREPPAWSYYDDRPTRMFGVTIASPVSLEVYTPLAVRSLGNPALRGGPTRR